MQVKVATAAAALGLAVAGCGGTSSLSSSSSAPDVNGGTASNQATLFRAANLSPVLDKVRSKLGSAYQGALLKVEPRDVKLVGQGAPGLETVTVDNKGKSFVVRTPGAGFTAFDVSVVQPAAAQRAVDTVVKKAHIKLSDISYLTFTSNPISHQPAWGVYLRSGGYYSANSAGRHVSSHAAGTTAAAGSGAGGSPASGGAAGAGQSTATCIQNAGSDVSKIQKCTSG